MAACQGSGTRDHQFHVSSGYLARVAEGLGRDSSRIILEYLKRSDADTLPQGERLTESMLKRSRKLPMTNLVEAQQVCQEIERPIWKNSALERTADQRR